MARTRDLFAIGYVLLNSVGAEGQLFLSNAQVFDFQPGDVFQSRFESGSMWGANPPTYWTDTVVSRQDSQGLDTITYVMDHWSLGLPNGPNIPPTITNSWDTLVVTELMDSAEQYSAMYFCPPILDSIGAIEESCGRTTWWQYPSGDTCFFEPNGWISWTIAGCGGPYYSFGQDGFVGSRHLVYFHKGSEECGEFYSWPTGIDAHVVDMPIKAFPNPTAGFVHIEGDVLNDLRLQDAMGRERRIAMRSSIIDLSDQPVGVYSIIGTSRSGPPFKLRVVKN